MALTNPLVYHERVHLPHTRLYFECAPHVYLEYNSNCIGNLKGLAFPFKPLSVVFNYSVFNDESILNTFQREEYLAQLRQWGFKFQPPEDNPLLDRSTYIVKTNIHMLEWFATFVVLRYIYENPVLIYTWYTLVCKYPHCDKWLIFMMLHRTNSSHSLVHRYFIRYVDPVVQLNKIRAETPIEPTWTLEHMTESNSLFSYFGGIPTNLYGCQSGAYKPSDLIENQNLFTSAYEEMVELKRKHLNETHNT